MPKYEEIANILRDRIANGVYPVDSMLPIQSELSKEFGVSRMTIKKAVEILTIEGLIFSKQGNGTRDRILTSKIVQFAVEFPEAEIAERLQVEVTTPVYKIIRLRLLDEKPYVLEHTYMPCDLVPGLDESILLQSIYAYLWDELNLKFAGSYRHITAEKPDEYDKMYLDCQNDDPLLQVEQVVYLENGRPIEYSRSRNRFDTRGYSLLDVKNI